MFVLCDIVFISKEEDSGVQTIELNDLDAALYSAFVPIGEHVASLFTQGDLEKAASRLDTNTSAVLFLWEKCVGGQHPQSGCR